MKSQFPTIEALQPAAGEGALNAFCAGQRVVSVDRHFVDQGASSYWSLCVATVDGADSVRRATRTQDAARGMPGTLQCTHPPASAVAAARVVIAGDNRNNNIGFRFAPAQASQVAALDQMTFLSAASRRQKANALRQAGRRSAERLPKRRLHGIH